MFRTLFIRFYQFLELCEKEKFLRALKISMYSKEEIVPVEKDLNLLEPLPRSLESDGLEFVEIFEDNLRTNRFEYPLKSRQKKTVRNLKLGFRTFAIAKENRVIGDIWYVTKSSSKLRNIHPDLKLLGFSLGPDEVYMFDMYVTPEERGRAIATSLMGGALHMLKNRGFRKAYGFFVADNIPALWVHRLLKQKELPRILMKRYLFIRSSQHL